MPSGRVARRLFLSLPPPPLRRLRRTGRFSSFARCATEDKPCAAGAARDSQNQRKENPMNTDKLSAGGVSPSVKSKKREGRKHCLGYSNWSLLVWSWWGGKMGCGCAGRGLRRDISRGLRLSHVVVVGCGAAVDSGVIVFVGRFRAGRKRWG